MRTLGLLRDVVLRRHRRRPDLAIVRASSVRIEGDQLVMNYGEFLADHTDELILTVTIEP